MYPVRPFQSHPKKILSYLAVGQDLYLTVSRCSPFSYIFLTENPCNLLSLTYKKLIYKGGLGWLLLARSVEFEPKRSMICIVLYHSEAEMIHQQILGKAFAVMTLLGALLCSALQKRPLELLAFSSKFCLSLIQVKLFLPAVLIVRFFHVRVGSKISLTDSSYALCCNFNYFVLCFCTETHRKNVDLWSVFRYYEIKDFGSFRGLCPLDPHQSSTLEPMGS